MGWPYRNNPLVLLAKKGSGITINSVADMNRHKIGVVKDDVGEQQVLALGVDKKALKGSSKQPQVAKKLATGRVDLWSIKLTAAKLILKDLGYNPNDFEVVYTVSESGVYYAFSPDVDDATIKALQQGIDAVKESGEYKTIMDKYY
ncbi:substrate-binding periplasmic protein [Dongshaea marina]|uniref:substrate-binding periplasmic protein n=1 Tax=Dongshaea marina TaxID=2047966 RepID=UPI000D3EB6CF|nr:transporter substrate-binding domain-containing protein [Dongshaea marina]